MFISSRSIQKDRIQPKVCALPAKKKADSAKSLNSAFIVFARYSSFMSSPVRTGTKGDTFDTFVSLLVAPIKVRLLLAH